MLSADEQGPPNSSLTKKAADPPMLKPLNNCSPEERKVLCDLKQSGVEAMKGGDFDGAADAFSKALQFS